MAAISAEQDKKIIENMVGDVDWSLSTWLRGGARLSRGRGGCSVVYGGSGELLGISGWEYSDKIFPNSIQFGMRLWVHPDCRDLGIPSLLCKHGLELAAGARHIAWTSFNESRSAMPRLLSKRARTGSLEQRQLWEGFKTLPHQQLLNSVFQWITYKDFSAD